MISRGHSILSKRNAFKMRFKPTLGYSDPAIEHATRRLHTVCIRAFCLRQLVAVTRQWPLPTEPQLHL